MPIANYSMTPVLCQLSHILITKPLVVSQSGMRRKLIPAFLLLPLWVAAQVQVPGTPAGRQFAGWLAAFNAGGDTLREFIQVNFPSRAAQVDRDLAMSKRTGGFDLKKIEESSPTKIVALVRERAGDGFAHITLEVSPDAPHNIVGFQGQPVSRPVEFSLPHLTEAQLIAETGKKLSTEAAADQFSGAVLVAKNGKPVFAEAYGLADRDKKTPNTLKTRFRIGSMNKMFTAVAILQLAQAGKLDLNAPIGRYLPGYPNQQVASKVTIHHLLTHTGGTGDFMGPEYQQHRADMRTLNDYIKLLGGRGLTFEPGSKWEYSNYGFLLLGAIIEHASGQSYYDYVRDHVYKPAGMTATGSDPESSGVPGLSIGYTKIQGGEPQPAVGWQPNTATLPYRGTSAGGGYSTVEDLLRFAQALQQNKLLNAKFTEMLTTAKVPTPIGGGYAYGFSDREFNGSLCFGHNGGALGMNGDLEICPASGYVVAVLANLDPPAAERASEFITNRLPEN